MFGFESNKKGLTKYLRHVRAIKGGNLVNPKKQRMYRRPRPWTVEDHGTFYVRSDGAVVNRKPTVGFLWNGKQILTNKTA